MLPVANPNVIFKALADGAVLFSPTVEVYFGLNEVGARIWQLLPEANGSFDALCAAVAAAYPTVPEATIRVDARELLDELVREGLAIDPATAASDGRAEAPSTR